MTAFLQNCRIFSPCLLRPFSGTVSEKADRAEARRKMGSVPLRDPVRLREKGRRKLFLPSEISSHPHPPVLPSLNNQRREKWPPNSEEAQRRISSRRRRRRPPLSSALLIRTQGQVTFLACLVVPTPNPTTRGIGNCFASGKTLLTYDCRGRSSLSRRYLTLTSYF